MVFEISKKVGATIQGAQAALQKRASTVLADRPRYEKLLTECGWTPDEIETILSAVHL